MSSIEEKDELLEEEVSTSLDMMGGPLDILIGASRATLVS